MPAKNKTVANKETALRTELAAISESLRAQAELIRDINRALSDRAVPYELLEGKTESEQLEIYDSAIGQLELELQRLKTRRTTLKAKLESGFTSKAPVVSGDKPWLHWRKIEQNRWEASSFRGKYTIFMRSALAGAGYAWNYAYGGDGYVDPSPRTLEAAKAAALEHHCTIVAQAAAQAAGSAKGQTSNRPRT